MNRHFLSIVAVGWFASMSVAAESKTESPRPLAPNEAGINRLAPAVTGTTADGRPFDLAAYAKDKKAVVVAVTSTTCPLSKKYLPTLAALEKEFAAKGVAFAFVNPVSTDKAADIKAAAGTVAGPYLHDKDGSVCKALGVTTTTEVVVLDAKRTVQYRGATDDQYGLGYTKEAAKESYLKDALAAVLAGKPPHLRATTAPGCDLDLASATAPAAVKPTYHNRISRIIQQNCQDCHREGGVGPFAMDTRDDILSHKGTIKKVLAKGIMPPWFAAKPKDAKHSPFMNDVTLSDDDKADLLAWMEAGGPEGDKADAPLARTYPKEWVIGKPDAVIELPRPVEVKASGVMKYVEQVVETKFTEDKWLQGYEIKPTDGSVVHHVLVFLLSGPKPAFEFLDRPQGLEALSFLAAYVPGNTHQVLPAGYATKIPKGSRLRFQMHYTPNGKATTDQTKLAMVFAKEPPKTEVHVSGAANPKELIIPPGDPNKEVVATMPKLPEDRVITGFSPHMHVRGKACKYEAVMPDGKVKLLMEVPAYDFNWQLQYKLAEPITLPKGTRIRFTAWFDNSTGNPANPDPKKEVRWGPQTFEEMNLGYYVYHAPAK